MKAGMKVYGLSETFAQLFHAGERVEDKARKTMHRGADKIVEEAKKNAPVDTHALEKSIRKEVSYGRRGRLQLQIVMGGVVDGIDVTEYAVRIHETYDREHMGLGSQLKQVFYPENMIGAKFLERASDKVLPKLEAEMIASVKSEWKL